MPSSDHGLLGTRIRPRWGLTRVPGKPWNSTHQAASDLAGSADCRYMSGMEMGLYSAAGEVQRWNRNSGGGVHDKLRQGEGSGKEGACEEGRGLRSWGWRGRMTRRPGQARCAPRVK